MKGRVAGVVMCCAVMAAVVGCKKTPATPDPVPTPSPSPSPSSPTGLSGTWIGLVAEGMGGTVVAPYDGSNPAAGNCTIQFDLEITWTQAGTVVSGSATAVNRVNCPERGRGPFSDIVRFPLGALLVPPDTIVVENFYERGETALTGTYTATAVDVTARAPHGNGGIRSYTLRLRRR